MCLQRKKNCKKVSLEKNTWLTQVCQEHSPTKPTTMQSSPNHNTKLTNKLDISCQQHGTATMGTRPSRRCVSLSCLDSHQVDFDRTMLSLTRSFQTALMEIPNEREMCRLNGGALSQRFNVERWHPQSPAETGDEELTSNANCHARVVPCSYFQDVKRRSSDLRKNVFWEQCWGTHPRPKLQLSTTNSSQ